MATIVRFVLEDTDKEKLQMEARRLGLSMSGFLRLLLNQWFDGIRFEREKEVKSDKPKSTTTRRDNSSAVLRA